MVLLTLNKQDYVQNFVVDYLDPEPELEPEPKLKRNSKIGTGTGTAINHYGSTILLPRFVHASALQRAPQSMKILYFFIL
jgi:hypothetical protein